MSYQPPPEGPSGDKPPEEQPQMNPPVQPDPSPTINMSGNPGSQPPQGGYTPPPSDYGSSQGGYSPPPPPPQGGYMPPPAGGSGYTPPPGGYSPPPAGGGGYGNYGGTPPPAPPGAAGAGGFNQADLQSVFQSWINAVTKPNVMTYEGESRNATWMKVIVGVAAVAIVSLIMKLLFAGAANAALNPFFDQIENAMRQQGQGVDLSPYRNLGNGGGAIGAFISVIIGFFIFFIGSGWLYLMARLFGGQDSDFLSHSYLLSISYAPLRMLVAVLGFIPCLAPIIVLYQLYLSGLALQASHRMPAGRAQMAVWIPIVVLLLFACACLVVVGILGVAALRSSNP